MVTKFKCDIGLKDISQLEKIEENDLIKILYYILDLLFDIKNDDDLEDSEKSENDDSQSEGEIEQNENDLNSSNEKIEVNNFNDNERTNSLKDKLEKLAEDYYIKNKDSSFNDILINKILNKRKNEDFNNNFIKDLNYLLCKNNEKKIDNIRKKKILQINLIILFYI